MTETTPTPNNDSTESEKVKVPLCLIGVSTLCKYCQKTEPKMYFASSPMSLVDEFMMCRSCLDENAVQDCMVCEICNKSCNALAKLTAQCNDPNCTAKHSLLACKDCVKEKTGK